MVALQAMLAWQLSYRLDRFVQDNKLGVVVTEMLFVLDSKQDLQRRPDVAFVSYPRWLDKTVPNTAAWNVVPDLAVEVVSPTNLAEEIDVKITEYFEAGASSGVDFVPGNGPAIRLQLSQQLHRVGTVQPGQGGRRAARLSAAD